MHYHIPRTVVDGGSEKDTKRSPSSFNFTRISLSRDKAPDKSARGYRFTTTHYPTTLPGRANNCCRYAIALPPEFASAVSLSLPSANNKEHIVLYMRCAHLLSIVLSHKILCCSNKLGILSLISKQSR